ncbi:MAG: bifunctional folylpolyglutamate synthase/dihydrofolate synthase [Prevotella sp.]|nr:bifunctional folylpolyglutamate synthase/dihydrofolate synthase [Prevotella sp.]
MNYKETLEYLYNVAPAFEKAGAGAYKEGLVNTVALDNHFGNPHRKYLTIHVAGTNGKGSCSHTLAAVLQAQGYRTGLYTSPHLRDFRERIRVNGVPVTEGRVMRFVEEERAFFEPLCPSFFELTTALAFEYFAEEAVDIAVIEVGLGGRLDCTNIIRPVLSVITNISLDHTQLLGGTLEAIAREKAGIIKEGVPCLIGEYTRETRPVFEAVARERNAPLYFADTFDCPEVEFGLHGAYQEKNRRTILSAVALLRYKMEISDAALRRGMADVCALTGLEGRWQEICSHPLVICDTGHNLAGWEYLAPQIAGVFNKRKGSGAVLRIVFGMVDDKDIMSILRLLPAGAKYYFCQADNHRAIPSERVAMMARACGLIGESYPSVASAYNTAYGEAGENDFIFVGGSSYVVADFLNSLTA